MSLNALYVDFNSYFASVEQQLQPALRGKPIAVLPVMAETTCCIAASYEAKAFGVKTGTMVREARKLCKNIIFVEARPPMYVDYHHKLIEIVESCTHVEKIHSIDEMVCKLTGSQRLQKNALVLAAKIKQAIAEQYPFIRCSIGIAPNTFLSKVASNMQKPDGCTVIESHEIPDKLFKLKPSDLNGIGRQMDTRLQRYGITSMQALYAAKRDQLRTIWGGIEGERMYDKLRGIEPFYVENARSSLGHSHVLPPEQRSLEGAKAVLHRLLQKAAMRLRNYALLTAHLRIKIKFRHPKTGEITRFYNERNLCTTDNTLRLTNALECLLDALPPSARTLTPCAVSIDFSALSPLEAAAYDLFSVKPTAAEVKLNQVLDKLNLKYGKNAVYFGGAHTALQHAPMRIAFNHIPDLVLES